MNPKQILMNQLQNQLKSRNPQLFKQFEEMKKGNPQEVLNQITGNYTPEQKQEFIKYANNFGITQEQLQQYGINTK